MCITDLPPCTARLSTQAPITSRINENLESNFLQREGFIKSLNLDIWWLSQKCLKVMFLKQISGVSAIFWCSNSSLLLLLLLLLLLFFNCCCSSSCLPFLVYLGSYSVTLLSDLVVSSRTLKKDKQQNAKRKKGSFTRRQTSTLMRIMMTWCCFSFFFFFS